MHISDVGEKSHGRSDYWYGWRMCAPSSSSSVKRVLSPQRHRHPQKFAKCKPLLSWVGLFSAPPEWFKGTGRWGRGRYYRILILSLYALERGKVLQINIVIYIFCNTNSLRPSIHILVCYGLQEKLSPLWPLSRKPLSLRYGVFCTVSVSHHPRVRVGVNGDRVWISAMEQSGNIKMIYLYWNYLTLLILIWPINNINVNNREDLIPQALTKVRQAHKLDPRRLLFTGVVVPLALKRSKQMRPVF